MPKTLRPAVEIKRISKSKANLFKHSRAKVGQFRKTIKLTRFNLKHKKIALKWKDRLLSLDLEIS